MTTKLKESDAWFAGILKREKFEKNSIYLLSALLVQCETTFDFSYSQSIFVYVSEWFVQVDTESFAQFSSKIS